jgi:hypothetical protein
MATAGNETKKLSREKGVKIHLRKCAAKGRQLTSLIY